jgi:hypothetical protein
MGLGITAEWVNWGDIVTADEVSLRPYIQDIQEVAVFLDPLQKTFGFEVSTNDPLSS